MPVLKRGGVEIAWREQGDGAPILLIMGHRYSARMWYPVLEGLGERFRLVSFDNQGTGESGARRRTSIRQMAEDAVAVMEAAGLKDAHIYGVSMGGAIALELAIRHPRRVRSLILGCTLAKTQDIAMKIRWYHWLVYHLPRPILRRFGRRGKNHGYGDSASADRIKRDQMILAQDRCDPKGVWAQALAMAEYCVDPDDLRAITAPALVLHGGQDSTVSYEQGERLTFMLPTARLIFFPRAGHNYHVAEGERANREIEQFVLMVERLR